MAARRTMAAFGAGAAVYLLLIRPWQLRWGATRKEARAPMLGDDIVPSAHLQATRAVTIDAPPKEVWPWLVQMGGYTRAGWYSYDRIDNAGRPSAGRIVPELQHLQVGDVMPTAPDGTGFTVERIDPPSTLVLSIHAYEGTVSCCITLRESGDGSRLIVRLRVRARPTLRALAFLALMEVGDFVMMRKQLLTIRARAEGRRHDGQPAHRHHGVRRAGGAAAGRGADAAAGLRAGPGSE